VVNSETVGGIAPAAVIVIAILLGLATIATAMVDERFWGCNCHFDLFGGCMRKDSVFVQFEDTVSCAVAVKDFGN